MASKMICLFFFGMATADPSELAEMNMGNAMSKFMQPMQLQRPATQYGVQNGPIGMQSAMLNTLDEMEARSQEIQRLRARIQNMPQVDDQASSFGSFGWLAGFFASAGLVASLAFAAVRKSSGHVQHASELTSDSQISLVPQRAGPVVASARCSSVQMSVEDLVGGINDPIFGGTPEGKIFDPLGLGKDVGSLYRRRCVEIKHGRVCMVAFLGMTVGPNDLFQPSHALLSPSQDLHFDDIPGGMAAIGAVPVAGWAQIIALVGVHELTINKQDYTKVPGEIPTFLGFKPDDPEVFRDKQWKELKNGRLAMIAVLGEMMAQQVSGLGTYEQLGAMGQSLGL
jgi:light-harvesting complex I chlorophyll a/b binding protein 1